MAGKIVIDCEIRRGSTGRDAALNIPEGSAARQPDQLLLRISDA